VFSALPLLTYTHVRCGAVLKNTQNPTGFCRTNCPATPVPQRDSEQAQSQHLTKIAAGSYKGLSLWWFNQRID
jgi:hypothetical protein